MCYKCGYENYLSMAEEMLIEVDYEFAEDTIIKIKNWVEENQHITNKQKTALENIYNSIEGD